MENCKVAVVGTGYWGQNLVRNYKELGALKTVCDINSDALQVVARKYSDIHVTADFREVLEDPEIQGVVIALPAAMHFEFARRALGAGKDVYVEKPLALELEHAAELVATADKGRRILMVGHLLHYHPAFIKLKDMAQSGELGKIQYIYSNRLSLGKFRREENSLWSFAPHDISMLLSLCNDMPQMVSAFGANYLRENVADITTTHLAFPSGIRAHIFVSWLHPYKEHRLIVIADRKMVVFEDTQPWGKKLAVFPHMIRWSMGEPIPEKCEVEYVPLEPREPLRAECEHFLTCITTRQAPLTDGREGWRVLKVLQQAQVSLSKVLRISTEKDPPARPEGPGLDYFAHESAYVDAPCDIGAGTKIWHFSHILAGARIGRNCSLGQNVSVAHGVVMGDNVKVQNNVSIYSGTTIEDDVFLGPSCVLTNVTNPRSQVNRRNLYEKTLLRRGCSIGANATVVCGITVGRYAFVAAGAVVAKDVPDYALMVGVPARQAGWMSRHGHRLQGIDETGHYRCPESGLRYLEVEPGRLICVDLDEDASLPPELQVGRLTYDELKNRP